MRQTRPWNALIFVTAVFGLLGCEDTAKQSSVMVGKASPKPTAVPSGTSTPPPAGTSTPAPSGTQTPAPEPTATPAPRPPVSEAIDTLNYFLTKHPEVALISAAGSDVNQIIDWNLNQAYLMKWGPRSFIKYHWDANYIYFDEEHEMDFPTAGAQARNYSFTPGYWFKRQMVVGDSLDGSAAGNINTVITYYDTPHTCTVEKQSRYFMKTILESHQPAYQAGGDLGVQDVIVLRIEQGAFSEKEIYSRQYGLIGWQYCNTAGTSCSLTVNWNKFSPNAPKTLVREASCLGAPQLSQLDEIRQLSNYYFGAISQNTPAVQNQLAYLAAGGTMAGLADYFMLIRYSWIAYYGAPPPHYNWVDVGMNFLIVDHGTSDQYRTAVQEAVARWYP